MRVSTATEEILLMAKMNHSFLINNTTIRHKQPPQIKPPPNNEVKYEGGGDDEGVLTLGYLLKPIERPKNLIIC